MLRRAESAHDSTLLMLAQYALGDTSFQMGEFLLAKKHLETAISLYDPELHLPLLFRYAGVNAGANCLAYLGMTLWTLGYPDQALERGKEALALARAAMHPHSLASETCFLGILHQFRREAAADEEMAESVVAISAEHGFTLWLGQGAIHRGWAMTEQERGEQGVAQLEEGVTALRATGAEIGWPYVLTLLAEAYRNTGRIDEGLGALVEAQAAADKHEERAHQAEIYRLKGELLIRQDLSKLADTHGCFQQSLEIARKQSAKSPELRATTSLARMLAQQGRRDEARAMLAEIYGWFTEGFDTADLKEAKELLHDLSK